MTEWKPGPPISELVSLKGKCAVVTGGAAGIGLAVVSRFAEAGAAVVMADVDRMKGEKAAQELSTRGYSAFFVPCDVSNDREVEGMVDSAVKLMGGVDILVNNAGIFPFSLMEALTPELFEKVLAVNLKGAFVCSREVARRMVERKSGGVIINIASIDAIRPSKPGLAAYDASKGGLWSLTKSLALELAPHRIRVNAIAPGGVMTEGVRRTMTQGSSGAPADMKAWLKEFLSRTALRRMGTPDEVARVALFLACDLSAYMTGSLVVVDGGQLIS
ncbi:MAG: SDR family oxidoreductase [Dehalococcoidia bacterium]|nr:SDR family oxidoreductase [Dehalococcoidia bacterium]